MPHSPSSGRSIQSLTPRYLAALALLAALAMGSFGALQSQFAKQRADGVIVNVAGKQRMLSQRAPRLLLEILAAPDAESREARRGELRDTIDLMRRDHRALVDGDPARGMPSTHSDSVTGAYAGEAGLDARVMTFLETLDELAELTPASLRTSTDLQSVLAESRSELLRDLNQVVGFYEAEATAGVTRVQKLEGAILALTLVTLAAVGFFLFRPLVAELRTQVEALVVRERDMGLVLENTQDGFALVSADGTTLATCSDRARAWFGEPTLAAGIAAYLFPDDHEARAMLELGWEDLDDSPMPREVVLDQLPRRTTRDGRTLELEYLPVVEGPALTHVLVVARDLTDQIAHERGHARARAVQHFIGHALRDPQGASLFVEDVTELIEEALRASEPPTDRLALMRIVHTIKGNTAVFGLTPLADRSHEIEDRMDDGVTGENLRADILTLQAEWHALMQETEGFLGSRDVAISVSANDYDALIARLRELGDVELLDFVRAWKFPRLSTLLVQLERQTKRLAGGIGREVEVALELEGGSDRVDLSPLRKFTPNLVHVLRNAIDHSMESPDERGALGKPKTPIIRLGARVSGDAVVIEVADDGRGIDWARVRERAEDLGLPHASHKDLCNALLADGLSTREVVTAISGRGVGMAALRREVTALSGRIDVDSEPGRGTRWRFVLPLPETATAARAA